MQTTIMVTETVQELLQIVQIHFNTHLDEKTLSYERLVTHLRYFVHRLFVGELAESEDDTLYEQVKAAYPRCHSGVEKICEYLQMKFPAQLTQEETMYLMLHISRVTDRKN